MNRDSPSDTSAQQSRRRFLATTGTTTAGSAAAPLLASTGQAAPLALQPVAKEGPDSLAAVGIIGAADTRALPAGVSVGEGQTLVTEFVSDVSMHRHWSRDSKAEAA